MKHRYEFLYCIITAWYQFGSFSQRVGLVDIKGHYYFLILFFLWKISIKEYFKRQKLNLFSSNNQGLITFFSWGVRRYNVSELGQYTLMEDSVCGINFCIFWKIEKSLFPQKVRSSEPQKFIYIYTYACCSIHTPHLQHLWSDPYLKSDRRSVVELFCGNIQHI